MISKEILLGESKNKLSRNEDNFINVELAASDRHMPETEDSYIIDEYKQYYKEKDKSQKYRLSFTITPYCTNVLFNVITEPVYKEGSDDCLLFVTDTTIGGSASYTINPLYTKDLYNYFRYKGYAYNGNRELIDKKEFIKDTGCSHKDAGDVKYHCGYDIFNNHYLRKLGFIIVNKYPATQAPYYRDLEFNTIKDCFRDRDGNVIKSLPLISNGYNNILSTPINLSLYKKATISTFFESIENNLSEENGWFGFINKSTIPVKNYSDAIINKCMNDYEAGDFVDMYPDRTLFSFVPKYNKYRNRVEPNWDYCITYPFSSDTRNYLIQNTGLTINGIKAKYADNALDLDNLQTSVTFKVFLKHNLNVGDYVTLSFIYDDNTFKETKQLRVYGVGVDEEDKEHYFSIKTVQLLNELFDDSNNFIIPKEVRVRKCENGVECKYYLRKFKKLADYNSSLNKLAFSQNAYSDPVAQIVFTEDINTEGLVDNLNRPLSEVFLTIVKRNKGWEKWYSTSQTTNTEDVEFSHCFGKVTSGYDLPDDEEVKNYNIHRLHNITTPHLNISVSPSPLESNIKIENIDEVFGDIVEFSPSKLKETVLSDVCYRFNTAQREIKLTPYRDFKFQEISKDQYEGTEQEVNDISFLSDVNSGKPNNKRIVNANLLPEGYYYKAHYGVKLREFSEEVNEGYHIELTYTANTTGGYTALITLDKNYYFQSGTSADFGTVVYVYKKLNGKYYEYICSGYCTSISENYRQVGLQFGDSVNVSSDCKIFKHNTEMPSYAYELKDGTGKYIWRELLSFSEIPAGSELYDSQFTNGAHYHHKNISFYLKRQDPHGNYKIGTQPEVLSDFIIDEKTKDVSGVKIKTDFDVIKC